MSSLILPSPSLPHSSGAFQQPSEKGGIVILGKMLSGKTSAAMKVTRSILLLTSYIFPSALGSDSLGFIAAQKSLKGLGTYEMISQDSNTLDDLIEGADSLKRSVAAWQNSKLTTIALVNELGTKGFVAIGKASSYLRIGEDLGLQRGIVASGIHVVAYGGMAYKAIKGYTYLAQLIEKNRKNPTQKWATRLAYLKFTLATGAAFAALLSLFTKASAIAAAGLVYSTGFSILEIGKEVSQLHSQTQKQKNPYANKIRRPTVIDLMV